MGPPGALFKVAFAFSNAFVRASLSLEEARRGALRNRHAIYLQPELTQVAPLRQFECSQLLSRPQLAVASSGLAAPQPHGHLRGGAVDGGGVQVGGDSVELLGPFGIGAAIDVRAGEVGARAVQWAECGVVAGKLQGQADAEILGLVSTTVEV